MYVCVCKFGHLSGETVNRHNGPNKGLPTASPLSLLYYNVIKFAKMGPHRVFPKYSRPYLANRRLASHDRLEGLPPKVKQVMGHPKVGITSRPPLPQFP